MDYNPKLVVLRARKNVPGVGRKLARHFNAYEVTCNSMPAVKVPDGAYVLNYGRSQWPIWYDSTKHTMINTPHAVGNCANKITTLELLEAARVPCLKFTRSRDEAVTWQDRWHSDGNAVIVRHTVTGKQGQGVELVRADKELPQAPLYTLFYDKTHEFRVHVFNGKVIDLVQKKRMGAKKLTALGLKAANMLTRNHKQGWVFAHNELICDKGEALYEEDNGREFIEALGIDAAQVVGATYCGVDVLARYDRNGDFVDAVVCEVNSAPGMSSATTFKAYCAAIEEYIK